MATKEPQDLLGNVVVEGDTVLLFLEYPRTLCRVSKIEPGGVSVPGTANQVTNGVIHLSVSFPIGFLPNGGRIPNFICVRDPASQALMDKLTDVQRGPSLVKP